jgi:hypothetical protein
MPVIHFRKKKSEKAAEAAAQDKVIRGVFVYSWFVATYLCCMADE